MSTTVYFATNRVVTNAADAINGYEAVMVPPLQPQDITYGTAVRRRGECGNRRAGGCVADQRRGAGRLFPKGASDLVQPGARSARVHSWFRQHILGCHHASCLQQGMARCIADAGDGHDRHRFQLAIAGKDNLRSNTRSGLPGGSAYGGELRAGSDGLFRQPAAHSRCSSRTGIPRYPLGPQHGQFGP